MEKVKIVLNGSDVLKKLTSYKEFQNVFNVVDSLFFESPFSDNAREHKHSTDADYLIIDLFTVTYEICKKENNYMTWFSKRNGSWKAGCNILSLSDILKMKWKEMIDEFVNNISKYFSLDKIILIRTKRPEYYVTEYHCRVSGNSYREINNSVKMIEDYFIEKINCRIIDLCGHYYSLYKKFGENNGFEYEEEFYVDITNCLIDVTSNEKSALTHIYPNYILLLKRYLKYYEHLEYTNLHRLFFDNNDLMDHIVLNLGKILIKKYMNEICSIKMKKHESFTSIYESFNFENCKELLEAIRCIEAIDNCDYSSAEVDFSIVFSQKMRVMKTMIPAIRTKCNFEKILGDIEINEKNIEICFNYLNLFLRREYRKCTELILRNTNLLVKPQLVDIWGSCISREIYNVNSGVLKINKYLYRCCCLHAFENKVELDESLLEKEGLFGSVWKKTIVKNELYRKAKDMIESSNSKWIILDFFDIIEKCFLYKGQTFILDLFAYNGPFFNLIKDECSNYLYMEQDDELIQERMDKLIDFLKNKYKGHIILNRHIRSNKYTTINGEIEYFTNTKKDELTRQNIFIRKWEEYFIKKTNCYYIDIAKDFLGDECAIWGVSQVHYETGFFKESIKIIEEIILQEPIQKAYEKYSFRTRIERILRFIKHNSLVILERMFNEYFMDKVLLQMEYEVIDQYKDVLEEIYECNYQNYMEMLEDFDFEKKNCIDLKEYIIMNCDLRL